MHFPFGCASDPNWQAQINDVLRFYMDTSQIAEADTEIAARAGELEPAQP
jgi:type IV pilus biogenesis protein CpaD/CtpE